MNERWENPRFTFPFEASKLMDEFVGRRLALATRTSPYIDMRSMNVVLDDERNERERPDIGGNVRGLDGVSKWGYGVGELCFYDDRYKLVYRFNASEISKGFQVAVGQIPGEAFMSGHLQALLYPSVPMSDLNLKVAISTHKDYKDVTVPHLVRSLVRNGISKSQILVVTGGEEEAGEGEFLDDIECIWREDSKMGFTALPELYGDDDVDYWLVLEDTCEVTSDFRLALDTIDAGMGQDVIFLEPPSKTCGMGFYCEYFLLEAIKAAENRSDAICDALCNMAGSYYSICDGYSVKGRRDVYGNGVEREVRLYEKAGIKKYAGTVANGGKP